MVSTGYQVWYKWFVGFQEAGSHGNKAHTADLGGPGLEPPTESGPASSLPVYALSVRHEAPPPQQRGCEDGREDGRDPPVPLFPSSHSSSTSKEDGVRSPAT